MGQTYTKKKNTRLRVLPNNEVTHLLPLRPPSWAVKQIMLRVLFLPPLTVVALRPVSLPLAVQIPRQVVMSRQQLKHQMAPSLSPPSRQPPWCPLT